MQKVERFFKQAFPLSADGGERKSFDDFWIRGVSLKCFQVWMAWANNWIEMVTSEGRLFLQTLFRTVSRQIEHG